MSSINIDTLIRPNIRGLIAYSSARSEYTGNDAIYLDANENGLGSALSEGYNRYPDPLQLQLKKAIAGIKGIDEQRQFLGNGSDEPIDLLIRSFCNPGKDSILVFPPTYGMYEVSARINDVFVKEVLLSKDFQIDADKALSQADENTKIIFICSPNNPTGNMIDKTSIITLLERFKGIVVVDEAYIDFVQGQSLLKELGNYNNIVILQTFSKAWGLAGLRLGMAFASKEIVSILNKVKAPYNINLATQMLALEALRSTAFLSQSIQNITDERKRLETIIAQLPFVEKIYPSCVNFILLKVLDAADLYNYLKRRNIIVRNRSNMPLCENCLRVTIGNAEENNLLITALNEYANV